jgi:hypothetical protein
MDNRLTEKEQDLGREYSRINTAMLNNWLGISIFIFMLTDLFYVHSPIELLAKASLFFGSLCQLAALVVFLQSFFLGIDECQAYLSEDFALSDRLGEKVRLYNRIIFKLVILSAISFCFTTSVTLATQLCL